MTQIMRFFKSKFCQTEEGGNKKRSNVDSWGPMFALTESTLAKIPEPARFLFKLGELAMEKVIKRDCGCREFHYMVSVDRDLSRHWHITLLHNKNGQFDRILPTVPPRGARIRKTNI